MTRIGRQRRTQRYAGFLAALLAVVCCSASSQPADSAQARAKLAAVRARIAQLSHRLGKELAQRDALSARLRDSELQVTSQRTRLESLRSAQLDAERRRTGLRVEQSRAQGALQSQRAALAAQLRTAYLIGRQEQLQLLLRQGSPAALGRTLAYYGYFAQARSAAIAALELESDRLQRTARAIDAETQTLQALQADAARDIAALEKARASRTAVVAAINGSLSSGGRELDGLKREEQAVESLIADLSKMLQDFPTEATRSFQQMRGRLPWPVQGKITARYQQSRAAGAARWNGVLIDAPSGAQVRAPYFGRVIYADWLQGLGLLLIVAHSGGYMTLYGHAEVLYKSVGDPVAPGDPLAAMNDAPGAAPQLYFEIREGRKTVDPQAWLRPAQ